MLVEDAMAHDRPSPRLIVRGCAVPLTFYRASAVTLILAGPVMLILAVGCLLINLRLSEDSPLFGLSRVTYSPHLNAGGTLLCALGFLGLILFHVPRFGRRGLIGPALLGIAYLVALGWYVAKAVTGTLCLPQCTSADLWMMGSATIISIPGLFLTLAAIRRIGLMPAWSTRVMSWTFAANLAFALPLIALVVDALSGWPVLYALVETPIYPALAAGIIVLTVSCSLASIAFTISISLLGIGFWRGIDRAGSASLGAALPVGTT
jgi:hypothetical protein